MIRAVVWVGVWFVGGVAHGGVVMIAVLHWPGLDDDRLFSYLGNLGSFVGGWATVIAVVVAWVTWKDELSKRDREHDLKVASGLREMGRHRGPYPRGRLQAWSHAMDSGWFDRMSIHDRDLFLAYAEFATFVLHAHLVRLHRDKWKNDGEEFWRAVETGIFMGEAQVDYAVTRLSIRTKGTRVVIPAGPLSPENTYALYDAVGFARPPRLS